jgi:hypothetical protein
MALELGSLRDALIDAGAGDGRGSRWLWAKEKKANTEAVLKRLGMELED